MSITHRISLRFKGFDIRVRQKVRRQYLEGTTHKISVPSTDPNPRRPSPSVTREWWWDGSLLHVEEINLFSLFRVWKESLTWESTIKWTPHYNLRWGSRPSEFWRSPVSSRRRHHTLTRTSTSYPSVKWIKVKTGSNRRDPSSYRKVKDGLEDHRF